MSDSIKIRQATAADYSSLADIMFEAVRRGSSKYTEQQREAWVPRVREGTEWEKRLAAQTIFLAAVPGQESEARPVGFMSLAANGYIDFAYVRPSFQGTGIFRRLFAAVESYAINVGESRLWVHASLMAQRPFLAMGFEVTQEQVVQIGDQTLPRFEMEKRIPEAS